MNAENQQTYILIFLYLLHVSYTHSKNYFHCLEETDHCLLGPHQKLPPAAAGDKYRDPQPDNMESERP